MQSKIEDEIVKAKKEAQAKLDEATRLTKLHQAYPDLQKYTGRWGKVAYYSKSVNSAITRFDLRYNCGCCADSPLEIWPYIETPNGNVYSDPPKFTVGERTQMYEYNSTPYDGWDASMRDAGIPESIIGAVSMHFRRTVDE